jgi:hypothetical protein
MLVRGSAPSALGVVVQTDGYESDRYDPNTLFSPKTLNRLLASLMQLVLRNDSGLNPKPYSKP